MKWLPVGLLPAALACGAVLAPIEAHAKVFLSVEQSQKDMFGAAALKPAPVVLTAAQQDHLHDVSSVSLPFQGNRVWEAAGGGWFVVDEVVGKHETITYSVGINADGTVRRVEILEYRETYGAEVAGDGWLKQFVGKNVDSPIKLGKDIDNISGATLSSKHVADGVKRGLAMYALVLRGH
jgi:Na+-transporting NADH:ubiquinone oxidoreductase subunit NqrC